MSKVYSQNFKDRTSTVGGITFPFLISDENTFIFHNKVKGLAKLKLKLRIKLGELASGVRLRRSIHKGVCYYGPFKGEFGHFLAHTLPFLMYLHRQGVKIIYCGMEIHRPFMVDDSGRSILHEMRPLRDFFAEVSPSSNSTVPPPDVQDEIKRFEKEAIESGWPFWNIGDNFYYWFIHRAWIMKNHTYTYNLKTAYSARKENACTIFPRKKGAGTSLNNGERWDYSAVIDLVAPFFDRVYLCGHPSQVEQLVVDNPKVEVAVSTDNAVMLNRIGRSRLIITQHSGIVYAGEYTHTDVLIIYKGGKSVKDIRSLNNTLRFKQQFQGNSKLFYAFNEEEISRTLQLLNPKND